ncbi:MAG: RNA polymerase sigma factor [Planctomycetia bacterium]|nr:RNA polymerase sigma factor [Planctomycetia bacterium]
MTTSTAARPTVKSPPAEADDRELAARFARGEPEAFDRLVEQYYRRVAGLAARLLGWGDGAQDVTQEVFLAALRNRGRFRGQSGLWTYLAAITVNRCRSVRRRAWLRERVLGVVGAGPRADAANAEGEPCAVRDETAAAVRQAVARLPATYREVIVLRYLEELPVSEVAEVLGLKRNAVEVRLTRGRKMLEKLLDGLL